MSSKMEPLALPMIGSDKGNTGFFDLGTSTSTLQNRKVCHPWAGLGRDASSNDEHGDTGTFPFPLAFGNLTFMPPPTAEIYPPSSLKEVFDSHRPRRKKILQFQETVNVRWVQARKDIEDDSRHGIWWSKEEVDDFKEKSRTVCKLFRKFEQPSRDFMRSSSVRNLCDKQNIDLHDLSTPRGFEARLCLDRSQKRKEALKDIVNHQRCPGANGTSLSKMSQQVSEPARMEALQMGLRDEAEVRGSSAPKTSSQVSLSFKRKIELLSKDMAPSGWRNNVCVTTKLNNEILDINFEESHKTNWQRQKVEQRNLIRDSKAKLVNEVSCYQRH